MVNYKDFLKVKEVQNIIRYVLFVIIILYVFLLGVVIVQLLRAILGGTWESENIIIGALSIIAGGIVTILVVLVNLSGKVGKIKGTLDEHLRKHK